MESWSNASEEKRYLFSDEMDFSLDAYMRSRRAMVEWDNNKASSYIFEKDGFISDKEVIKSFEFVDLGFPDLFKRPVHGSQPPLEASNYEQDSDSSTKVNSSTHVIALNSPLGKVESESRHSFSLVESKIHDSSLIDLKLGRLGDCKDASSDKNDNEGFSFQPMYPVSALTKRARTSSSLPTQTRVCQVNGCHKDLSSSKEYHKRHKVCDVHSKTAKVFVNGMEQRFCQQCSRFHLLAEFDDGKRSCRRRLAGHNERRRKPQFDYMSGKPHKILQSRQGTKYFEASLQKRPQFAFHNVFQGGVFYAGKYEQSNHQIGHIKLEDESIYSSQLANGQELSRASNSRSCALSLLSAQSQDLTTHCSAGSLISQGICSQQSDGQVSETPFGISFLDKNVPSQSFSCEINSMEVTKNRPIMPSDVVGHALQLEVHGDDDTYKPSDLLNSKYHPPVEHSSTIDLFQLSSHLQRVEQQRNSVPVKHENEDGCLIPTM